MSAADHQRLGFTERLGYGLGDTASNFVFQTSVIFLLFYYTDVYGIPAAAVGTMLFVTGLWDTVTDPMMGAIADRTNTRWGRFRPYLLWMAVPYGIIGYLVFAGPDLDATGKLIYAWVTLTLLKTLYTAINVPYSALMGVMSPVSKERTVLSSFRFVGAFGAGLLISMLTLPAVRHFGHGDDALGWQVTMAIFAVAAIVLFLVTFATTRERVAPALEEKVDLGNDLKILVQNLPWVVLFFVAILTLTHVALKGAITPHFFKYYIGDDGAKVFWFMDLTTLFLTLNPLALIAGVCCTKLLSDRFEKKPLMIALSLISAVFSGLLFVVPADNFVLLAVVSCLGSLAAGPTAPLVWAMYGDVADYGEWRFQRRTTGLIFSASMFAQKFGLTIGAGLAGWMLAWFGFIANQEQSELSQLGIRLLFTLVPAGFALLNVLVLCLYSLPDSQVAQIEADLEERKAAPAPSA